MEIPPPRVDFIDQRTGKISREWFIFLFSQNTIINEIMEITRVISSGGFLGANAAGDGEDGEDGISITGQKGETGPAGMIVPCMDSDEPEDQLFIIPENIQGGAARVTGLVVGTGKVMTVAGNRGVAYAKYDYSVDGGAVSTITPSRTTAIPDNSIIFGGAINVTTAVTAVGAATVAIGTSAGSSTTSILAATGKATLTIDKLLATVPTLAVPIKLTASGNITFTVGTDALTAGVIEVWLEYYTAAN